MLIDPNTGEVIGMSSQASQANSFVGQTGMDVASGMGYQEGPLMGMLANIPNASTSMFWNARRGGNTILRGGFARNSANKRGILRNHVAPRSFGRLSSVHNIDNTWGPPNTGRKSGMYSPFQILAKGGNWGANKVLGGTLKAAKAARGGDSTMGSRFHQRMGRAGIINTDINKGLAAGEKQQFFSPGFLSRQTASSKILSGGKINPKQILDSVGKLDPGLRTAMGDMATTRRTTLAHLNSSSMQGTISQRVSGYMTGARAGTPSNMTEGILKTAGKESYLRGSASAVQHLAAGGIEVVEGKAGLRIASGELGGKIATATGRAVGEKIGIKGAGMALKLGGPKAGLAMGARRAGMVIPGINFVMTAWMAYDLTKMGLSAATGMADTAKDAVQSFKGSMNKPIMGMGYKDNSVAATSRARGVAAIQNSRLNARSVLGSEAGPLAAHFG